eukprot:CAMPEP_0118889742 /NCGR_PEP_ID=MMETSP1166-20130328/522_1 /TAXON_ID=1104430 /ORGANISM="Chrysoreinhardia sp, Strain CCMP3193" /LENGTH=759 /DNA_ID=CAMNT_0006828337 /DNA_START=40 /DNA_END=2319 /DNA_ORIENTATION=-
MRMREVFFGVLLLCDVAKGFGFYEEEGEPSLGFFTRVATFPVCSQPDSTCEDDAEVTAAEIISMHVPSRTAVYSDSLKGALGFVDLSSAASPVGLGSLDVGGEPTSVAVVGTTALVAVNTSPDFLAPSGVLHAVDVPSRTVLATWDLGGQPDSIAVSPDGAYAAVAIENERDEDLGDGRIPQMPPGNLVVVSLADDVATWSTAAVNLTGLDGCFESSDPEPEYVAINADNVAVVTLQENNCIALVDLATATVTLSFDAGVEVLNNVDLSNDGLISQTESATFKREPDGVAWIGSSDYFATANEGDMDGGGRSFSIYSKVDGQMVYTSGADLDHLAAKVGHYPDERSDAKGSEPENIAYGSFGGTPLLFVNLERSSLVAVYDVSDVSAPIYKQVLPAAAAPEGSFAVPELGLLIVASEEDARGDKLRSSVNVYEYDANADAATYPTLTSASRRSDGTWIPFGALSGLASGGGSTLYSIEDSFYQRSRIFTIDAATFPYELTAEIPLVDSNDVFASVAPYGNFTADDLALLINDDKTVNVDPEGIAYATLLGESCFVVASEGSGTVGDPSRPINSLNFLFVTDLSGLIKDVVTLPDDVNDVQLRFGFEGVAVDSDVVYVAFQRAWNGEAGPRIGMFDYATKTWTFAWYPLDAVESPNGGWVGLSDLAPLGDHKFLVLERDNQGVTDARVKRVYSIDLNGVQDGDTITKTLEADLIPVLTSRGGLPYEKIEGLAVMDDGTRFVVNDNDGVSDNSGEIQLLTF